MATNDHIFSLYLKNKPLNESQELDTSVGLQCLICDFIIDDQKEIQLMANSLQKHLLTKHNLMIADIEGVYDLTKYCDHWRQKFTETEDLSRFCAVINTNCGSNDVLQSETYYMIGGNETQFPEDSELRQRLKESHLESILLQSESERNDHSFRRNCIFCRKVFDKNRTNLFNHLSNDHNFNVGNPDNIVNCGQLLDVLEDKLSKLECLYCEKTFKSWSILKEHMRKKGHKMLNPNNRLYDKYYLINYLSPEKDWRDIKLEVDGDLDEDNCEANEWEDWSEDIEPQHQCICLFCEFCDQINPLKDHLKRIHDFDFDAIVLNLDFYLRIKLINYIRRQIHDKKCHKCEQSFDKEDDLLVHLFFSSHIKQTPDQSQYDLPEYFFSTFENDNLLHFLDTIEDNDGNQDIDRQKS